jgi:hypothetical protein
MAAAKGAAMSSNPFDFTRDEPPPHPGRRRRKTVGLSALAAVGLAVALMGGMFLFTTVLDRLDNPPALSPQNDPYREDCAIVRKWLREKYGEVDIVSWGQRTTFRSQHSGDTSRLTVRFRRKGGRSILSGSFHIDALNQIVYSVIDD